MSVVQPPLHTASILEDKLSTATDPYLRVRYINDLISDYVYTKPVRARKLLGQLAAIYAAGHPRESDYLYFLHLGNLENQEYDDQKALKAFEKAVLRVDEHGDIGEKIEVYLDYLGILVNLGNMDLARDFYERSLRLMGSYSSARLRARVLCRQGFFYLHDHSYAKATPKFLEADRLLSGKEFELNTKDHYFYTLVHSGLGTLWTRPDSEDKAASAFQQAITRCEEKGLGARLPWHQLNLGKVLMSMEAYEEAIGNFQSIIDNNANGSKPALAAAYVNLGLCYYDTNESPGAVIRLLNHAEKIFLQSKQPKKQDLVSIELVRAQLFLDKKDFVGAIEKLQGTLEGIEQEKDTENLTLTGHAAEICQTLARSYAEIDAFDLAYYSQVEAEMYLDRYYELQDAKQQEQFAARFEAEAREKERESLQLRASQLQLRALRAQMNPHFLYNALNSIQSFITTKDASTASKYLAKFAMLMRRSLEYTNREYITLEDEILFLSDYLDINCHLRFDGQLSFNVDIQGELEEDIMGVPTMILQPYVENAIEHGLRTRPKGHIQVTFTQIPDDDDNIIATVVDDGIGRARVREMQENDVIRPYHQSRGTDITQSRLELLTDDPDNRVLIEDLFHSDGTAAGTKVTVRIPVADVLMRRGG
ncbi:tetratricopeptide repeat-containing sensor histidine kinase [Neolewinella persica]|uniref:tetratricopeptide repeat-containing sensor histidine kinase n=1 Tax=Neolewinella persica TaxID=70998 RepID=UPI000362EF7D|nr:histidine kinase [Neolewinella persica]